MLVVTWGNADVAMQKAWNGLTWAVAAVSQGNIVTPQGQSSAADYAAYAGAE